MASSQSTKVHSVTDEISVRRTHVEDLDAILEVRNDPKVRVQQYPIAAANNMMWKHMLSLPNPSWLSWTILHGDKIIGNVTGGLKQFNRQQACSLGWNLLPDYWGNGIMFRALKPVFDELAELETEILIADRFEQNDRCAGLLDKLKFKEVPIGRIERTIIWIFVPCPYRIIRSTLNLQRQQIESTFGSSG